MDLHLYKPGRGGLVVEARGVERKTGRPGFQRTEPWILPPRSHNPTTGVKGTIATELLFLANERYRRKYKIHRGQNASLRD